MWLYYVEGFVLCICTDIGVTVVLSLHMSELVLSFPICITINKTCLTILMYVAL